MLCKPGSRLRKAPWLAQGEPAHRRQCRCLQRSVDSRVLGNKEKTILKVGTTPCNRCQLWVAFFYVYKSRRDRCCGMFPTSLSLEKKIIKGKIPGWRPLPKARLPSKQAQSSIDMEVRLSWRKYPRANCVFFLALFKNSDVLLPDHKHVCTWGDFRWEGYCYTARKSTQQQECGLCPPLFVFPITEWALMFPISKITPVFSCVCWLQPALPQDNLLYPLCLPDIALLISEEGAWIPLVTVCRIPQHLECLVYFDSCREWGELKRNGHI